jgi:hypothetical protein
MKVTILLALFAGHALAAQPLLPRVTAKTLAELQNRDPMITLVKPAAGEAKVVRTNEPSIIKQSTILHYGTNWTIVPKGAVAYVPDNMKSRVDVAPSGTLLSWLDFLTNNRSWLSTCEITVNQATGTDPIPAERAAFWAKQDKVVIAVHQGGPITLRMDPSTPTLTKR